MQLQELWLVLAGFVLGFALSTLWEWLYYRRQRWLLPSPPLSPSQPGHELAVSPFEEERLAVSAPDERSQPAYRSPSIFLESEQDQLLYEARAVQPPLAPIPVRADPFTATVVDPAMLQQAIVDHADESADPAQPEAVTPTVADLTQPPPSESVADEPTQLVIVPAEAEPPLRAMPANKPERSASAGRHSPTIE